jgi:hypothetical protein
MRGRREERIEKIVDRIAAGVLAAAAGVSLFALFGTIAPGVRLALAAASALASYGLAVTLLGRVKPGSPKLPLRTFSPAELLVEEMDELLLTDQVELLLTDADRFKPARDELVLDDILARLGPQSRVVRLFDPLAMPTPGQLNARIEQHLHASPPKPAAADASEALYEALNELRRSLR